ncbi:MAG TPA: hypothetical protein VFB38_25820 [Chthonomonadaceae bacterium]|nr:hypothetical protein [Chthonomonadaceae bacterium]
MRPYGEDENAAPDEEQIIEEFLGEHPRARELRLMRAALEQRRAAFERDLERAAGESERASLKAKIAELNKQIEVLRQEEAITTFVEDSVRVTLHKPSLEDLEE